MSTGKDRPSDDNVRLLEPRAMGAQKLSQIERYWNRVRGNRLVPSRCEIDPRGLDGVLGDAFILERIAGGLARFRIAGSRISELGGTELRQMPISALFLPGSRDVLSEAMIASFDDPSIVRLGIASPGGFGRSRLEGQMILLPLRSDLGDIDRVLGGLTLDGQPGRAPRRFEILSQTRTSLTGYAGPSHNAPAPASEVPKPVRRATERDHLRLVVSND